MIKPSEQKKKPKRDYKKLILFAITTIIILIGIGIYIYTRNMTISIVSIIVLVIIIQTYKIVRSKLIQAARIKKMEEAFPDFIELMSSNLRAGMTVDKALLLSSRKEFAPLDEEILALGKDILTGKDISIAMMSMANRINSEKITKTIEIITTGIKSGGNLSIILEETAGNLRERGFVEKKAASSVLMYVIFVFFASTIGAPVLFALSTILVQTMTTLLAGIPTIETSSQLPFTLTQISVSVNFIIYFSLGFLIVTNILSSLVLGLVSKGEEKQGLKYLIPMLIISISLFFVVRYVLSGYFANFFG